MGSWWRVWRGVWTLSVMTVLTFTLGAPTAARFVWQKLWAGFAAVVAIWLGIRVGLLGDYGGPFGLPEGLLWLVGGLAGGMWLVVFVLISWRAWTNTLKVWREMLDDDPQGAGGL